MPKAKQTKQTPGQQQKKGKSKKGAEDVELTLEELHGRVKDVVAKNHRSQGTIEKYDGVTEAYRKWLVKTHEDAVKKDGHLPDIPEPTHEHIKDWENSAAMAKLARTSAWATCGDKPVWFSAQALGMFLVYKHDVDGTGSSWANVITSGIILHVEKLGDGQTYRGAWGKEGDTWRGNFVQSGYIADLKTSLKHAEQREGKVRQHALPMTKQYLQWLVEHTQAKAPEGSVMQAASTSVRTELMKSVAFRTFAVVAWTVWGRCFEVLRLRWGHIESNRQSKDGFRYDVVRLEDRKGSEGKQANSSGFDKETLRPGQAYNCYEIPHELFRDVPERLREWRTLYEELIGRPIQPDDYVFPRFNAGGPNPSLPATHEWVQQSLSDFVAATPELRDMNGSFTTHSFRRGGAQYRFLFAPPEERWLLDECQRWGGWSYGENQYTIVRYLIDELYQADHDVSDLMCPVNGRKQGERVTEKDQLDVMHGIMRLLAEWKVDIVTALQEAVRATDRTLGTELVSNLEQLFRPLAAPSTITPSSLSVQQISVPAALPTTTADTPSTATESNQPARQRTSRAIPSSAPLNLHIPVVDFGERAVHWENVIKDWDFPDESRNLKYALSKWDPSWISGVNNTTLYATYRARRTIAAEYIDKFGRNAEKFRAAYPAYARGTTALISAINAGKSIKRRMSAKQKAALEAADEAQRGQA